MGIAGGYTETDTFANGSADSEGGHVGLYGSHDQGPLNLSAALAYSWFDFDLSRRVGGGRATGEAEAEAVSGSLQVGYDVAPQMGFSGFELAPTLRVNGVSASRDAFEEDGAFLFNLDVEEDELAQVIPAIGLAFGTTITTGQLVLRPELAVFYEHVLGDDEVVSEALIPVNDAGFVTSLSAGDEERISVGAGLGATFTDWLSGHVRYDGSFGDNTEHHRGSLDLTVKF